MNDLTQAINAANQQLKPLLDAPIDCAVILGSGLSDLALKHYQVRSRIAYHDLPGLPATTAPSHKGELIILSNGVKTICLCAGRQHLYEGYSAQQVCMMVYILKSLGTKELIITNAAGALNPNFQPGEIMLINDHINFTGQNPLIGQDESLGTRFPDMSAAYHPGLLKKTNKIAEKLTIKCHQGVYIGVTGPSLETSAERRYFRSIGADAVGMSTVLEVIAANHCDLDVLGISAITNLALGDEHQEPDTVEKVLQNAAIAGNKIKHILNQLLA